MAKLLGLDIGEKRIGVALADAAAPFPSPLTTLEATSALATDFKVILDKHKVTTVVVGYPRNQQGEATEQTKRVQHIVKLLKIPDTVQIMWQDESLTSVKAEDELKRRGKPYDKGDIDALAATYILNDYIASHSTHHHHGHSAIASHTSTKVNHAPTSKKHRGRRPLKWIIMSAVLAGLIGVVAAVGWYISALQPLTEDDMYKVVTVEQGSGTAEIATELQNAHVIKNARAFTLYARLSGIDNLQAGTYRLSSADSVSEIATIIADGKVTTVNVLIPPGLRQDEIVDILKNEGYDEADIAAALTEVRDHPVLEGYPKDQPIEGYLYPNTYQIEPTTSAEQLLRAMLDEFEAVLTPKLLAGIESQALTLRQAITIASIVQKEVPEPDVQKQVAQVFISRYKQGIALGADPTYKYAAARFGTINNPSSPSPYNTRRFTGLTPTPIANFNLSALEAVADPANTDYLYFVSGDDGKTYFSRTLEEHEANTAKYCIEGCR